MVDYDTVCELHEDHRHFKEGKEESALIAPACFGGGGWRALDDGTTVCRHTSSYWVCLQTVLLRMKRLLGIILAL